jgi:hypothetical protein
MKLLHIYLWMLTDITWESSCSKAHEGQSQVKYVLCCIEKQSVWVPFSLMNPLSLAPVILTCLKSIYFVRRGAQWLVVQKDGASPHFHHDVRNFLYYCSQGKGLAGAGLSLGCLIHLTSNPPWFWGGGGGYNKDAVLCTYLHWLPLCWNLLMDKSCSNFSYTQLT